MAEIRTLISDETREKLALIAETNERIDQINDRIKAANSIDAFLEEIREVKKPKMPKKPRRHLNGNSGPRINTSV